MKKRKSAASTKVTYHRFAVVDTKKPRAKAVSVDVASPKLEALRQMKGFDLKGFRGKVVFKRAVPRATKLDGSSASKRLVVKNGEVIGAQG
jgi:hypothetical protein